MCRGIQGTGVPTEITRRRAYRAASRGILADPDPAVRKSNRREGFGALEHLTVGRYGEPPEDPLLLFSVLYAAAIPELYRLQRRLGARACGLGILGGVAAGAIIGSAIANSPPPPPPGYYPPPPAGYPPPPPGAAYPRPPTYAQLAPGCHWGHERVWVDGYGYQRRTVPVCP
jgi:hypothetical protein